MNRKAQNSLLGPEAKRKQTSPIGHFGANVRSNLGTQKKKISEFLYLCLFYDIWKHKK